MAQTVKSLPAMQEIQVRSLGQEDILEEGMATYSSILASRIPWTEEPGGLQSMGHKESHMTEQLILHYRVQCTLWALGNFSIRKSILIAFDQHHFDT